MQKSDRDSISLGFLWFSWFGDILSSMLSHYTSISYIYGSNWYKTCVPVSGLHRANDSEPWWYGVIALGNDDAALPVGGVNLHR